MARGGAEEDCPLELVEEDGSPKGFPLPDDDPVVGFPPEGEKEFEEPIALTSVGRNTAEIEIKSLNKSSEFLRN